MLKKLEFEWDNRINGYIFGDKDRGGSILKITYCGINYEWMIYLNWLGKTQFWHDLDLAKKECILLYNEEYIKKITSEITIKQLLTCLDNIKNYTKDTKIIELIDYCLKEILSGVE